MQQSKYRGCINTAAVVSIPLRRFLCIRFVSIPQERKPNSLWLFSVRCRYIASDHRAVATWPSGGAHVAIGRCSRSHRAMFTWPSGGGRWKFRGKNGNHRGKNEKSRRSSIPLPGICRPMLVRKGSRYSQKISVPQVAQGRMAPRNNQANIQVTFIKSLADRIIF